jgi:hypothetical protein
MGREIRKVPKGWEHPRDDAGCFIPMFDRTLAEAQAGWDEGNAAWGDAEAYRDAGGWLPEGDEDRVFAENTYEAWDGPRPSGRLYRPEFTGPADHFQYYENTTEGTPLSPVFGSKSELIQWLNSKNGRLFVSSGALQKQGMTND